MQEIYRPVEFPYNAHDEQTSAFQVQSDEDSSGETVPEVELVRDPSQRALAVLTMGWDVAKETSGDKWLAPFLAELLNDPYTAIRFLAGQSLWKIQEFKNLFHNV